MLDLDGRIVSWNAGAERLKQYSSQEILGQHFSRFYTPEDRAAEVPSHALRIAKETGRFHAEGWRIRKDGTRFWALVVIDAIRNPAGELVGFAKITRDITDKFDAHQELAQSESRYAVVHQGRLNPGVDLIQKPISQADLATRIRRALDKAPG